MIAYVGNTGVPPPGLSPGVLKTLQSGVGIRSSSAGVAAAGTVRCCRVRFSG
ncbi:hypothetical protein [Actinacidiphila rubida]|uniref:hypothetical protein n=1 Tax=Actinacidiphila rubida TaxID=310780 RepID=UPI00159F0CD6|nr:hypothetical protein [Actinacidiphila rubida]